MNVLSVRRTTCPGRQAGARSFASLLLCLALLAGLAPGAVTLSAASPGPASGTLIPPVDEKLTSVVPPPPELMDRLAETGALPPLDQLMASPSPGSIPTRPCWHS